MARSTGGARRRLPADAQDYFQQRPAQRRQPEPGRAARSWMTNNFADAGARRHRAGSVGGPRDHVAGLAASRPDRAAASPAPTNADVQRVSIDGRRCPHQFQRAAELRHWPVVRRGQRRRVHELSVQPELPDAVAAQPAGCARRPLATGMGPVGIWVNGVAVFNAPDGASFRNAASDDFGGGMVATDAFTCRRRRSRVARRRLGRW